MPKAYRPSKPYDLPPLTDQDFINYKYSFNPLRYNNKKHGHDNDDFEKDQNKVTITNHYNKRPEIGKDYRKNSPIYNLKSFNNWIKSVLISSFARFTKPSFARVLDIGCGKGGDLNKWLRSNIIDYVGLDIADISVDQAGKRYQQMRNKNFNALFYPLDCFKVIFLFYYYYYYY